MEISRVMRCSAEDDDVLEHREAVGLVLVVAHAVRRGVDDFVVAALGAELLDQLEDRFALHHHARLAPEGVVVGGLALVVGVVVEVVHHNLDEPLLLGPLEDGFVQRRAYQLGNDGYDVDAHLCNRFLEFSVSGAFPAPDISDISDFSALRGHSGQAAGGANLRRGPFAGRVAGASRRQGGAPLSCGRCGGGR